MQNSTYLCPRDRKVMKGHSICPTCGRPAVYMGTRWRAPKLSNEAAWVRVQSGDIFWEDSKIKDPGRRSGRDRAQKKSSSGIPKWYRHLAYVRAFPARDWNAEMRQAILENMMLDTPS